MKPRIVEQADRTGDKIKYSWLLDGVPYAHRNRPSMIGWKWLRCVGGPGGYVTNDPDRAAAFAEWFSLTITSNGTHATAGAPMYFDREPATL